MLYDIKSKYLIEIVFSALNAKIKLELAKYNKNLQNIMNINLINYKILSGRYILNEINGQKKEYNAYNGNLVFIGEYSHGKRNGKGKEYKTYKNNNNSINNKLIFEGEYSNGKRNGKGIEYNNFCGNFIKFEGDFFRSKKWNGKGYDNNDNIIYELINGNGKIKEYNEKDRLIFEGEYLNGKRYNGKGYDSNGNITYELINGDGKISEYDDGKLIFECECLNGQIKKEKHYYLTYYTSLFPEEKLKKQVPKIQSCIIIIFI